MAAQGASSGCRRAKLRRLWALQSGMWADQIDVAEDAGGDVPGNAVNKKEKRTTRDAKETNWMDAR